MEPHLSLGMPSSVSSLVILALLFVSAFFSMAETALVSASRPRLVALARKGSRRAARANAMRERQSEALSAILLGYNLANVVASALATGVMIDWFGEAGIAYAALAMTILIVVFGEVLPKTLALNRADRTLLAIVGILEAALMVLQPVSRAVDWIVRLTLRLFGAHKSERNAETAADELRGAIELHKDGEDGGGKAQKMLRSVLDLANVQIGEIMVHRRNVFSVDAEQKPAAIIEQILASPHTRVPLWRGQPENIVGVLHVRDLLNALRVKVRDPDSIDILGVAQRPWFVPESTSLLDQLEAFRRRHQHFAVVVDEYGALMGVVTLNDILSEIVGDIGDRPAHVVPGVRAEPDGSFVVDGHVTIRDLNREYEWNLPDAKASTIAGLVLEEARRIPDIGQVLTFHGFRFEILRKRRNQIAAIRVTRAPAAATAA